MQGRAVLISHARSAPGDKTGGSVPKDGFLDPKFLKTQVARVQYVDSQQERGKGGRQRGEEWGVAKQTHKALAGSSTSSHCGL
ncbi:MAG: hypothetical protein FRX49_11717 [Trebouxia sp. A1-2]|nr:MAG: hypothetical protein FRX49_11717 [Trebouxia sp. A1-2]